MPYVLNVVYMLLILAASPWLVYQAIRKGKYREGFAAKFLGRVPQRTSKKTCLWLHAVSVGEVNLLATLLKEIAARRPDWECVVSTTTMTGMALAKKKYPQLAVFYCPLDFSWAVRAAMRQIRPDVLVLAELELWPNLIRAAKECGARVAVVNGRLSEHSFRGYRRLRPLVGRLLGQIDLIAGQDETYAGRFRDLGAQEQTLCVTGSMKYDGAETERTNPATTRLRQLAGFADDDIVFLAGSTQEPEEALALAAYRTLAPQWPQLRWWWSLGTRTVLTRSADCWTNRGWPGNAELGWTRRGRRRTLGSCWSTRWASWGPGGARLASPMSAGAWGAAAARI